MTDTTCLVNDALEIYLVLEGLKLQAYLGQSGRVAPELIRMKEKMSLALKDLAIVYLEKDHGKLGKVPIFVLTDIVRWMDKLIGTLI